MCPHYPREAGFSSVFPALLQTALAFILKRIWVWLVLHGALTHGGTVPIEPWMACCQGCVLVYGVENV